MVEQGSRGPGKEGTWAQGQGRVFIAGGPPHPVRWRRRGKVRVHAETSRGPGRAWDMRNGTAMAPVFVMKSKEGSSPATGLVYGSPQLLP